MITRSSRRRREAGLEIVPRLERAVRRIAQHLGERDELGAGHAEAQILAFLLAHGQSRIGDLHAQTGHRRSTLTSLVDRLEARRILRRTRDPLDARAFLLELTPSGSMLAGRVHQCLKAIESEALRRLSNRDMEAFARVVDAFAAVRTPNEDAATARVR